MRLTFPEIHSRWPDWPGHVHLEAFHWRSRREQAEAWSDLAERCRLRIESEMELDRQLEEPWCRVCRSHDHDGPPWQPCSKPSSPPPPRPSRHFRKLDTGRHERAEWLRSIPAEVYVERLTGQPVGPTRKISCPFHDERTASLHAYPGERGWHCFGCGRGGDIFTLASEITEIPAHGSDFKVLVAALTEVFG